MSLIAILLSLAVEIFWEPIEQWRRFEWYDRFCEWTRLRDRTWGAGPLGVLATIVPPLVGVWLVYALLDNLWGLLGFLFSVLVLIFSLGPRDLFKQVHLLTNAVEREDMPAASAEARELLGKSISDFTPQTSEQIEQTILLRTNDNFMGVFFWFVLLGPVGAALFRLSCLCMQRSEGLDDGLAKAGRDLYRILSWPSARITVLGFAIAGNFVDTMKYWDHFSDFWRADSESLLIRSGLGALGRDEGPATQEEIDVSVFHHALSLVKRTIVTWVTVLALMTIAGWLV
jgi:membrane protein required for beta-lactamase induction